MAMAIATAVATTAEAAADLPSNSRTPRSPTSSGLPSPWAQVVRGGAAEDSVNSASPPPPEEFSPPDNLPSGEGSDGGNVGKKLAWCKPSSNVVVSEEAASTNTTTTTTAAVMGAFTWPALSESTRPSQKSSFCDHPKSTTDESATVSQGPVTQHSKQSKQGSANPNHNSSMNKVAPYGQKSVKHGVGGGNRQGSFTRDPPTSSPVPVSPVPEVVHSTVGNVGPFSGNDSSSTETRPMGVATQTHPMNDHSSHRSSNRRGNFGQNGRGNGRNNYNGGRRDHQDHGNYDWSSSQISHPRESRGHSHRPSVRGSMRPPVRAAAPFVLPFPMNSYGNAMVYPDVPHPQYYLPMPPPELFGGVPYFAGLPPPPPYIVMPDPNLPSLIVKQIDYYFSDANLVKDAFLRSKMDDQGWVPITLIASFPLVRKLTDSIPYILHCLGVSSVVEVQGNQIRRRDEWMKWIPRYRSSSDSGIQFQSPASYTGVNLSSSFQKASLEELSQDSMMVNQTLGDLNNKLRMTESEVRIQGVC